MEARINKQHTIARNGPHRQEWNRITKLEMRFLAIFIFRKQ